MSDLESYQSASLNNDILEKNSAADQILDDHRNQLPSLLFTGAQDASVAVSDSEETEDEKFERKLNSPSSVSQSAPGNTAKASERVLEQKRPPLRVHRASHPESDALRDEEFFELQQHRIPRKKIPQYMNNLRRDYYLQGNELEGGGTLYIPDRRQYFNPVGLYDNQFGGNNKISKDSNEENKLNKSPTKVTADSDRNGSTASGGILLNPNSNHHSKSRKNSTTTPQPGLSKIKTNDSKNSDYGKPKRQRRSSRGSVGSEADSHASRSSQETEEDVCFPMLREHIRVNGIDFDEIEEFIKQEREEQFGRKTLQMFDEVPRNNFRNEMSPASPVSKNAMKYTPVHLWNKKGVKSLKGKLSHRGSTSSSLDKFDSADEKSHDTYSDEKRYQKENAGKVEVNPKDSSSSEYVTFGGTKIDSGDGSLPERFSFFNSKSEETVHAPDISSLVSEGQSVQELFRNAEATWWLDCTCPTDAEMKMLAKAFGLHPLTAEDIRMQEAREKVELFRSYYFVSFHTFANDEESEDYLQPINVYIVVFKEGVLTFHFSPFYHGTNVRRRVRQLRDYLDVSPDWVCYALIDDITDGFAPVITGIEHEADVIEDSVFAGGQLDFREMLQRIGEARRKVMTLMRLLSGKADVIKMFAKRCQDEAAVNQYNLNVQNSTFVPNYNTHFNNGNIMNEGAQNILGFLPQQYQGQCDRARPRADIALYLGDIQDHILTMFQNLLAYEKIFSRSHSNYLAQLQVESFHSNNMVTQMFSKVTIIGTIIIPLNVITGLFGMNVQVPGQEAKNLGWFFGILGVMVVIVVALVICTNLWLNKMNDATVIGPSASSRSFKSISRFRERTKEVAKSIISTPNKYE